MTRAVLLLLAACGSSVVRPSTPEPLPPHTAAAIDTSPKERPRMLAQEPYLRAYLAWFGGLAPLDVQNKARAGGLFDSWGDYLAALGMPDDRIDLPRATQSNALMVATLARLGEALCVLAAERDLDLNTEPGKRVVFAFDLKAAPSRDEFAPRFDAVHRLFLSYPVALAPHARIDRFYALYRDVAARPHPGSSLDADKTAWAAVCTALVQHPEARLY